jgi:hypothetical protein
VRVKARVQRKVNARIAALVLILLFAVTAVLSVRRHWIRIPAQYDPWATLEIDARPNFLTRYKLSRLSRDPALCAAVLARASFRFQTLPDQETGPSCGFQNAVQIEHLAAAATVPFALTCRAAVSLALWERHVVTPTAEAHFGQGIKTIEHFGSYSCRNVYGRPSGTRSRHATAEALDVAGFILKDGQRIRVLLDWQESTREAQFLHEVRTGACAFFDGVLSPDYNAAHRDHLHLDRGPYRMCR